MFISSLASILLDYEKCLPADHPDKKDAQKALVDVLLMAQKTNEIVRSKQNQEQKKELIDKYGALLHKNPKKLQDIMRWRLYKIGKVNCLSLDEQNCDLVIVSERDHRNRIRKIRNFR